MHIELDQSTQLVAANRTRKWYPEEKDWVLNKMQERLIRSKLRPKKDAQGNLTGGFELDQTGGDDIRMLVVNKLSLVPYIADIERYKCFLPSNYAYLLSDGSRTKLICDATVVEPTGTHVFTINMLRQEQSPKPDSKYYETLELQLPDQTINIPDDLPPFNDYLGYPEKKDISFLVPWILWKSKTWYWERFDNIHDPSWYLQVALSSGGASGIIIDGFDINDDVSNYADPKSATRTYTYHTAAGNLVNNRLCATDIIRNLRQSRYFGTAYYSPITELENNLLWIYRDNSFIVSGVEISYIRKPQPISLSLNTDCELAEGTHQILCDMAVEYLQGRVQDVKGVQLSEADLVKRVVL